MVARARREAIEARRTWAQRLLGCVTDRPLHAIGPVHQVEQSLRLSFVPVLEPAPLRASRLGRVGLVVNLDVQVDAATRSTDIVAYSYRIVTGDEEEVLAYHWHPRGLSPVVHPHLHLSRHAVDALAGDSSKSAPLVDLHLPTGHVDLAAVVRFLIAEAGVPARRADWADVLARDAL